MAAAVNNVCVVEIDAVKVYYTCVAEDRRFTLRNEIAFEQ